MSRTMMHDAHGFTLIECLVYCCVVGIFVTTVIPALLSCCVSVAHMQQSGYAMISACVATDFFYRDVSQQRSRFCVLASDSKNLVWRSDDTNSVGWCVQDGCLVRTEGEYVPSTKSWKKSTSSILCQNIVEGQFFVDEAHSPIKVQMRIRTQRGILERVVWV